MYKPKSADKRLISRKTSSEPRSRDAAARGAKQVSDKDTKPSTPIILNNHGMRSQLSALFQSSLLNNSTGRRCIEKNFTNKSGLLLQPKWLESGYLEQPSRPIVT